MSVSCKKGSWLKSGKRSSPRVKWKNELTPTYKLCVEVCGFTFVFHSRDQLIETRDWFQAKVHKSTRLPDGPWLRAEHDVAQRWYERLPAHIKKGSKRAKVVKALNIAINKYS